MGLDVDALSSRGPVASATSTTHHMLRFRDTIVEAIAARDTSRLRSLVALARSATIDAKTLAATGLGVLFSDTAFLQILDDASRAVASECVEKRRRLWQLRTDHIVRKDVRHPLGGIKVEPFLTAVGELEEWLMLMNGYTDGAPTNLYRRAATALTLNNVTMWRHLAGTLPEEVAELGRDPLERALLRRASAAANDQRDSKRCRVQEAESMSPASVPKIEDLARGIVPPPFVQGRLAADCVADNLSQEQFCSVPSSRSWTRRPPLASRVLARHARGRRSRRSRARGSGTQRV